MAEQHTAGFLSKHGAALIDAGYNIIPIKPGKKAPGFDDWEKLRLTKTELAKYVANGHAKSGVGFLTKHTPGVDLDIRDGDLAEEMEDWCLDHIGAAPVRIGMPPKRLLLYRTDDPFRKVSSKVFLDDIGVDHKVEILGDGQQFVGFHIHPDTHKPYAWLRGEGPLVTDAHDLQTLSEAQARAVVAEFERRARERGWTPKKGTVAAPGSSLAKVDQDDPFAADVQKISIDPKELHRKLLLVPGADIYETWLQIGMALFHQFDGAEEGRALWHEWSEPAHNYDPDALDRKWDTFDISDKKRAPVTARLIIKLAKEEEKRDAAEALQEIQAALQIVETMDALDEACQRVKHIDFDAARRELICGIVRSAFRRITGQPLGIKLARDMVRYESPAGAEQPAWLKDWIYLSADESFFNSRNLNQLSREAFNSVYGREMLTKQEVAEGRDIPSSLPSNAALNRFQIQVVRDRRYLPGQDDLFTMGGIPYVNTYTTRNQPECPTTYTAVDQNNIKIVERHFATLVDDEREREIFKDYLAWVVQTASRPNWAILLQGTESDGKTFFATMMGAVLGEDNVGILNAKNMEEGFNAWAEGSLMTFVEEVKMHGHNRYDVLNQIKPLITNSAISIRRMRRDPYKVPNTTAYILFTNFRDALPLVANDTRFFVMFSRFQTKERLKEWMAANPGYYPRLYGALDESAGAIRKWLLERKLSPYFDPEARAPDSNAQRYMVEMNKSEEMQAIEEILSESTEWDMCKQLLNATALVDLMVGKDCEIPQTRTIKKLLSDSGYTYLGRVRVGGVYSRYWSQEPHRFLSDGNVRASWVRDWVENGL